MLKDHDFDRLTRLEILYLKMQYCREDLPLFPCGSLKKAVKTLCKFQVEQFARETKKSIPSVKQVRLIGDLVPVYDLEDEVIDLGNRAFDAYMSLQKPLLKAGVQDGDEIMVFFNHFKFSL